ncbi:MAG: class I adenylate-forming enzyme family protein [Minwuia sp.]|nr:class I adenylate-forming enzyme family protein [Minwuia sp.]
MTQSDNFLTVDNLFKNAVARYEDRPFIVSDGTTWSYSALDREVSRLAAGMISLGVQPGDRIALWMSNVWEWIVVQFAATRAGAVLTPINTRLRVDDLTHILRDSGARILFTQGESNEFSYLTVLEEVVRSLGRDSDLEHVVVARPPRDLPPDHLSWAEACDLGTPTSVFSPADDVSSMAYILYTSGTTSLPKGVMLSHRSLNNARNLATAFRDGDVTFLVYPLFAITGCQNEVLRALFVGGTIVLQERFDAREALEIIEHVGCTTIGCITGVLEEIGALPAFTTDRVATLRLANVFPRRPESLELFERFGLEAVSTGYGMTETSGPSSFLADMDPETMTTEGFPLAQVEIRLMTEGGREAAADEDGAILVRSPFNMNGYFNNASATHKTIDQDGWLHTGDVGRFDKKGRLIWMGRFNDIIKSSGFNFASREVEAFLERHDAVQEISIVGVPDRRRGEVAAAFIVPSAPGAVPGVEDIQAFCKGRLASYKIPAFVFGRATLPKTASGKVRKVELKEWFLSSERSDP